MKQVQENLYVGSDYDCHNVSRNEWSVIHACKTCHAKRIGYRGSLSQSHPNYLVKEDSNHLYLNMVDMKETLKPGYTHPIIAAAMKFIRNWIPTKRVLIHCNEGYSRAPSIALLHLARERVISNDDYETARQEFLMIYPMYSPARGIESYLRVYWTELLEI